MTDAESHLSESPAEFEATPEYRPVRRALLSVTDKTGIVEFARGLRACGVEIISTGGTARELIKAEIPVTAVQAVTGQEEILDGRVKTLDPKIFGPMLADQTNPEHVRVLEEQGMLDGIDLVACNLYDFEGTLEQTDDPDAIVESIDIGGPSMIRAAAKNHKSVCSVVDPTDYDTILAEIHWCGGTSLKSRKRLAKEAFALTAEYDEKIDAWFSGYADEEVSTSWESVKPNSWSVRAQ